MLHPPLHHSFFFLLLPPPPTPTLFPYTTLFRSASAFGPAPCANSGRPPPFPPTTSRAARSTAPEFAQDRKSTRLNSSHITISYAVFCLKKKTNNSIKNNHSR